MIKKILVTGCIIFTLILNMVGCNTRQSAIIKEKIIGSKMPGAMTANKDENISLEALCGYADLIIIGTVASDGSATVKNYPDSKISFEFTDSKIDVDEVIYGTLDSKELRLRQLGKPESDVGETKVKKGDKMLFILHQIEGDIYNSIDVENGLFYIKNDKTFSLSDNKNVCKYDDKVLKTLTNDIKKIKTSKN